MDNFEFTIKTFEKVPIVFGSVNYNYEQLNELSNEQLEELIDDKWLVDFDNEIVGYILLQITVQNILIKRSVKRLELLLNENEVSKKRRLE